MGHSALISPHVTPRRSSRGFRHGEELARIVGTADVLVFPSLTDTFGLAMIEALATGVPVAAFPVPGPIDVIEQGVTGVLHDDLHVAVRSALNLDRSVCALRAAAFTWTAATEQFLAGLEPDPSGPSSNPGRPPQFRYYLAHSRADESAWLLASGTGDAN